MYFSIFHEEKEMVAGVLTSKRTMTSQDTKREPRTAAKVVYNPTESTSSYLVTTP